MAKILIIEPNESVRALLAIQVSQLGHEPVTRDSALFDLGAFDVAVIEPAAPGGLLLAQRLHDGGVAPSVFVSIHEPTPATRALGPVAHIVKPYRMTDLAAALRAAGGST